MDKTFVEKDLHF